VLPRREHLWGSMGSTLRGLATIRMPPRASQAVASLTEVGIITGSLTCTQLLESRAPIRSSTTSVGRAAMPRQHEAILHRIIGQHQPLLR
jgi:hypothetical protein